MEKGKCEGVRIGGLTVGRATYEPGWRWSEHVGPTVGAKPCTVAHVGVVVSGTATAALDDGRVCELRAGELFYIPQIPHDSWTVTEGRRSMSTPGGRHKPEDGHFMRRALRQAEIALSKGQTPCGAVILDGDGQLIGAGHNTVRAERNPTAHGEVVAMREAWRRVGGQQRLRGGTVYSTIEPCLLCAFVITQFGFRRVVFAARGTDVPTYKPLLGADLVVAAAWVNAQPDWTPLEVVGDFMRARSVELIMAFPWRQASPHTASEARSCR